MRCRQRQIHGEPWTNVVFLVCLTLKCICPLLSDENSKDAPSTLDQFYRISVRNSLNSSTCMKCDQAMTCINSNTMESTHGIRSSIAVTESLKGCINTHLKTFTCCYKSFIPVACLLTLWSLMQSEEHQRKMWADQVSGRHCIPVMDERNVSKLQNRWN